MQGALKEKQRRRPSNHLHKVRARAFRIHTTHLHRFGEKGVNRAILDRRAERVTGNRGRGQENQNIKLSVWTTAKNSTVLGVSEHAESIG